MKTLKQEWDELCARQFDSRLQDDQREIMQWAFYKGFACLLVKINSWADNPISREEAVKYFNNTRDEIIAFIESPAIYADRKGKDTH
jgi:hypothetical protein